MIVVLSCDKQQKESTKKAVVFEPNWMSLRNHQTPHWFEGMRFGIYTHWGLSAVKQLPGNKDLSTEDLIPLFHPDKFNAKEWAKLYKDAGAQFAGPVAWHGSDYKHWDSDISNFNMVDNGPGLDFVGEMEKAIKAEGMKYMVSLHSGWNKEWLAYGQEVVNKYQPDIFWVDAGFGGTKKAVNKKNYTGGKLSGKDNTIGDLPSNLQKQFIASFYNDAINKNREVEFVYKQFDIPPGIGTRDIENGLLQDVQYDFWMTDIDMNIHQDNIYTPENGTWFYIEGRPLKNANTIVDMLADVVSKNGCLLLNIPPKADGSFSKEVSNTLLDVGDWLKINSEAIYNAVPWSIYGEGVANFHAEGHHSDHSGKHSWTENDFRFTTGGNNIYAMCLGLPSKSTIKIRALGAAGKLDDRISSVEILGYSGKVEWNQTREELNINIPSNLNLKHAVTFKVICSN